MTDRSHVSLETHICKVCGAQFETGALLLDKRLRPHMERTTTTGWGMCPEHQRLADEDYIALIEIKNMAADFMELEKADRTGRIMHMRRAKAAEMFNVPIPKEIAFIDKELFDLLFSLVPGEPK